MAEYLIQGETLTAIGDAIRAKDGSTAQISPGDMPAKIAAIETGGGSIELIAVFQATNEINATMRSYPFAPKYQNELIVWNTKGYAAPGGGSVTPYAFLVFIINGAPWKTSFWISGAANTAPWEDSAYKIARRDDSAYSLDDSGQLVIPSGTWGFLGTGTLAELYEIPLPIGQDESTGDDSGSEESTTQTGADTPGVATDAEITDAEALAIITGGATV